MQLDGVGGVRSQGLFSGSNGCATIRTEHVAQSRRVGSGWEVGERGFAEVKKGDASR